MKTLLPPENGKADPYRAAQLADFSDVARAWAMVDSGRREKAALICALVLALVADVVLAGKSQHDVVVYRESPHGVALMSEGVQTRTPLESSVEHQLGLWLADVRDVPGTDDALAQRNAHNALVMTAKESPADRDIVALFRSDQNPSALGAKMTRTVVGFVASPVVGTHTYVLGWNELVEPRGGSPQSWSCSGSVAIATPEIPSDVVVGAIDPAGVYVEAYQLQCKPASAR